MATVTCIYCKEKFDREKVPTVKVTERRYAHASCAEKNQVVQTAADKSYSDLVDYIEKLFGTGYVSAKVAKQIKDYGISYQYTHQSILNALIYWYEVRKAPLDRDKNFGGIGIVPYIHEEARLYFEKLEQVKEINKNVKGYQLKYKNIEISPPQREVRTKKLFDLEDK